MAKPRQVWTGLIRPKIIKARNVSVFLCWGIRYSHIRNNKMVANTDRILAPPLRIVLFPKSEEIIEALHILYKKLLMFG